MEAIILAGGLGTRLRGIMPDLPKPMAPVRGRPFLEHQIDYWIGQGVNRFILALGYKRTIISNHFGTSYRGTDICYVVEDEPLGTGGALLHAIDYLRPKTTFLVLNGDTYFEVPLAGMAIFHRQVKASVSFAVFTRGTESRGRYMGMTLDTDGRICSLAACSGDGLTSVANGGAYLVEPDVFSGVLRPEHTPMSLETDLFPAIQRHGARLHGFLCSGRFIDIGVPEDYYRAEALLP
ncbi:MAG: sugar phosphate nucleotidyltransferase [Sulfobacillus sp.]